MTKRSKDQETTTVSMDEIDPDTVEIMGIRRPDGWGLPLTDEARIQTIERRIASGARRVWDVMSPEERAWLESIGAEAEVRFQLRSGKKESGLLGKMKKHKDKPIPTLADDLLATKSRTLIEASVNDKAKHLLRSAKRFVLTEEAAIKIGEAIRAYPEMLVEHGWFARTPFETCWIEFPSRNFHEAIVPGSSTPDADDRVGYLFHGDMAFVGASNGNENGADCSPLVYHLHQPDSLEKQLQHCQTMQVSRAQLDNFYWGRTMAENLPHHVLKGLRAQHGFSVVCEERYRGAIKGADWLGFSAGEVRNIIGLLLMINQPSGVIRTTDVAHRRVVGKRGTRVLMGHSIVTLNLDRRSKPDRLLRRPHGSHASPRWHEVVDHWCNDEKARTLGYSADDPKTFGRGTHAHVWEKDDAKLVATCSICGGRRWRRRMKNGRGDRSRGTIGQTRVVITNENLEREPA